MGAQHERMMLAMERDEQIVKRLTILTGEGLIPWRKEVFAPTRTYTAFFKGMNLQLRDVGYTLDIDSYTIGGMVGDVPATLMEELDSAVQLFLSPAPRRPRLDYNEQAKEILNRLNE